MTTNWQKTARTHTSDRAQLQTTDPIPKPLMYQWGAAISFQTWPLNVYELDHDSDTDWAQKEIAGAAIYREWVGENDETLYFRGKLFPYRIGGMSEIEIFEASRRAGAAQMLVRGGNPSYILGWFVCEKLVRSHTFLSSEGVGQQIAFEAQMVRVPTPAYQETQIGRDTYIGVVKN